MAVGSKQKQCNKHGRTVSLNYQNRSPHAEVRIQSVNVVIKSEPRLAESIHA